MPAAPILRVPRPSRVTSFLSARLGQPMIDADVVQWVLEQFGFDVRSSPRNLRLSRRSLNAAVATDRGPKVVKQYRPDWKASTVAYGHSVLTRLEELEYPAVRLERTDDGRSFVESDERVFAVFDFVPGTNYSLNYLIRSQRLALTAVAARTLAAMHLALRAFEPTGAHHLGFSSMTGPRWRDAAWHRAKVAELVQRSASERGVASAWVERLRHEAARLVDEIEVLDRALSEAELVRLVIHGDYGLHNLLYSRGVAIPVDFEVARLDWRVNDLVSALGKHRYRGGHYDFESMEVFARAYGAVYPLTAIEQEKFADAWRLYKLQAAVQYWNGYFQTNGPVRKLASAVDSIEQASWVEENSPVLGDLAAVAGGGRR